MKSGGETTRAPTNEEKNASDEGREGSTNKWKSKGCKALDETKREMNKESKKKD